MAWRLGKSVIKGEIDNRKQGRVTGRLWLVEREEPIELSLDGDCYRDIAGSRIRFVNPHPESGDHTNLFAIQEGTAGDMTASRRVRVLDVSVEQARAMREAGERIPERLSNSLYLEWYSTRNGRVVIESSEFRIDISEPEWRMGEEEEMLQAQASHEAAEEWVERLAAAEGVFDDEGDPFIAAPEGPMDEFAWEQSLRESDALTDRFAELFEKYLDHPDRDRIIAKEMGWTWLEEAVEAQERGELVMDPDEFEDLEPIEPDPLREGRDWVRTKDGRVAHPLSLRAYDLGQRIWTLCEELSGDGESDADLQEMVFQTQCLSAKLSGALDGLAYGDEAESGFIVACLKRTLKYVNAVLGAAEKVALKKIMSVKSLAEFRQELFAIRQEILSLMSHFRAKPW